MSRKRAVNGAGMQPLRRSDGRWMGCYVAGYDAGTGKPIKKYVYGKTSEECSKKLRAAVAALDSGQYFEPSKMTLKAWLEIWLQEYTNAIKPSTVISYTQNVNNHIVPNLGAARLGSLRPHDVQRFINKLSKAGKLSAKSIKNISGILHKALDTAVRAGYISTNPVDNMDLPRVDRKDICPLEGAQIDDFVRASEGLPQEHFYFVALYTGMRLSELLGLRWSCIDFKNGTIRIDKQLLVKREKGAKWELGSPKNGKPRTIKAAPAVMERLKAEKRIQNTNRLKAGEAWQNNMNLVFTDVIGQPLPHPTIERRYKKLVSAIGLPDRRFHDLRHTYATECLRLNVPIKTLSENLGHASVAFTMDIYGHVTAEMKADAADIIQAAIELRKAAK